MAAFGYLPRKGIVKDALFRLVGYPGFVRRLQAPALLKFLAPARGSVALDLGCGCGWLSRELARRCRRVVGADARLDAEDASRATLRNLDFIRCEGARLPFAAGAFDRVVLSSVLQMVADDRALLREVKRVLAPGGRAVVSVPVGYRYLERLYGGGGAARAALRALVRLFGFPGSLEELKGRLSAAFGVRGKGYYSIAELRALCAESGFAVGEMRYTPAACSSLVHELRLAFCLILGLNPSSRWLFALFPLFWWERHFPAGRGDEIVAGLEHA